MKKRLIQTKLYYKFFYSSRKETSHKPSKVAAAENFFRSLFVVGTAHFNECFLFHKIIGRHYYTNLTLPKGILRGICVLCSLSPQVTVNYHVMLITMLLIPMTQIKRSTS